MAKTKQKGLSPKQRQAIELLLEGNSKQSVCRILDMGATTLNTWHKIPEFREELERSQEEIFTQACGRIKSNICLAGDILAELMKSDDPGIQYKAASKVIDSGLKLKEIFDLETRLRALEESNRM